ncbi:NAD(P)/FAD-dependent oxidoreductase [Sulfitobacter sp.]|uniref:NAD(P)/FAD-dependent oxidoreductase n=1 Tax=Sulfitobacter sp. TaxID=1903071 RepID=UPI003002CD9A
MIHSTDQAPKIETHFDCIVIGAGIAGTTVAAELARVMNVALLERENQPGYHTTGRSAALYTVAYGPPIIRALTRASGPFFNVPDSPYLTEPLLSKRGAVFVARKDQLAALAALKEELGSAVKSLDASQVTQMVPLLREGYAAGGLHDEAASDIDVHALHQHYLRVFKAAGGTLVTRAEVTTIRRGEDWIVHTTAGRFRAPVVVNASGAWGDEIAALAGVAPRGLTPKQRTAMIVAAPEGMTPDGWPMVVDVEEQFYLKPDAGKLLISPADAEPTVPCDAQPDELWVAHCIDRIERAFDLSVRRIENKWAGLRNFLPSGCPLAAYDTDARGFFWLVGQGGYGIQTAPALARAAAALIQHKPIPKDIADEGVTADSLCCDKGVQTEQQVASS